MIYQIYTFALHSFISLYINLVINHATKPVSLAVSVILNKALLWFIRFFLSRTAFGVLLDDVNITTEYYGLDILLSWL